MIKRTPNRLKRWLTSLRSRFLLVFAIAAVFAVALYILGTFFSQLYIKDVYLSEERRKEREEDFLRDLQGYIDRNGISSSETEKIAGWAKENRYVYLLVYRGNELFFTSDDVPKADTDEDEGEGTGSNDTDSVPGDESGSADDKDNTGGTGGVTIEYPTREELLEYAKQNEMYLLKLADSGENIDTPPVFAQFTEYTEYFYYDITNIVFLMVAAVAVVGIMLLYIRRVTGRIIRLGNDVNKVAAGDTEKRIRADGKDEIAELAVNVESMRSSIIENYKKEKEALDANTALITSMSHDIRTPLTVLLGYMDVMRAHAEGDEQMQGYIKAAETTAMRLKKLSDDMFSYFLVFGGKEMIPEIECYDAETLVEQMLAEHILLMRENGYTIDLDGFNSAHLAGKTVMTDAQWLVRIFDNAFSNIYKYADKASAVKISLALDPCKINIVFSNVIRTDGEKVESNGIGLKTCQKLAEKMNADFSHGADGNAYYVRLSLQYKPKDTEK